MSKKAHHKHGEKHQWEIELTEALKSWVANHPKYNNHTVEVAEKTIKNVIRGVKRFKRMKVLAPLEYELWRVTEKYFSHNRHHH